MIFSSVYIKPPRHFVIPVSHYRFYSAHHIPIHSDTDQLQINQFINTNEFNYIKRYQLRNNRLNRPVVGIAVSGGGYRSLTVCSALLSQLEQYNYIPYINYISGTSGATWYMSQLYTHHLTCQPCSINTQSSNYYQHIHNILRSKLTTHHMISINTLNYRQLIKNIIYAYATMKSLSVIDLLSYAIDATFLHSTNNNHSIDLFTSHHQSLHNNVLPYPIYNMIDGINQLFYCMTPDEFQCIDLQCSIPINSVHHRYTNGTPDVTQAEHEQLIKLCTVLAICGSAFCVDINRILSELKYHVPSTYLNLLHYMIQNRSMLTSQLIASYKINNILYNLSNEQQSQINHINHDKLIELCQQPQITLSDAGTLCNVPFHSLLRRHCNIIICIDNSTPPDIYDAYSIKQMYVYGKQYNIKLPELSDSNIQYIKPCNTSYKSLLGGTIPNIDHHFTHVKLQLIQQMSYSLCTIIHGNKPSNIPTILYIPLIKNDKFNSDYDPRQLCIQRQHLHTFNLHYTVDQFNQLSELVQWNLNEIIDEIRHVLDS